MLYGQLPKRCRVCCVRPDPFRRQGRRRVQNGVRTRFPVEGLTLRTRGLSESQTYIFSFREGPRDSFCLVYGFSQTPHISAEGLSRKPAGKVLNNWANQREGTAGAQIVEQDMGGFLRNDDGGVTGRGRVVSIHQPQREPYRQSIRCQQRQDQETKGPYSLKWSRNLSGELASD